MKKGIPFVSGDSVAFLNKGDARSVAWMGDFNAWGYDHSFDNREKRIPGTDIWILKTSFPQDARLDYKIVIDESKWILDPANTRYQWSGVGGGSPNSDLRMPDWKEDPLTRSRLPRAIPGRVDHDRLYNSQSLGYPVMYSVYLPYHYDPGRTYPVIWVTDGYAYMHEHMGNMNTILDNLIFQGAIEPVVAVVY